MTAELVAEAVATLESVVATARAVPMSRFLRASAAPVNGSEQPVQ
ncbi:MAG: hypothetical protein WKF84_01745 [Pyrinomonadaceae bacterium]